ALEPFATDGVGRVIDDDRTYIYSFLAFRPLRLAMAKRMMFHIKKNFPQLPFAERWVVKSKKDEFALRYLIRKSVVFPYYVLKEKTGGMISQAEHTVIVTQDGNEVIT
ncbi:MAG: type II methionyl aminopeptidase, partial [Candidatus Methanofastidiosia archaeon]